MVQFQKLINLFLTYTGKTYTVSSSNCPSFSCATSSSLARAYCGAAGPVSKLAPQQEKAFCLLRFEVSRSVITVQRVFRASRTMHGASFLNRAGVQLKCHHRSGHLKTENTESLFLLRRRLGNWPRSSAASTSKPTAGSA